MDGKVIRASGSRGARGARGVGVRSVADGAFDLVVRNPLGEEIGGVVRVGDVLEEALVIADTLLKNGVAPEKVLGPSR